MKDSCLHITSSADCLSTAVCAAASYITFLCVKCPTSYFVLNVTVSNPNCSLAHRILPDDKTVH